MCCWFWWMLLAVNVQNKLFCHIFTKLSYKPEPCVAKFDECCECPKTNHAASFSPYCHLLTNGNLRNSLTIAERKEGKNVKNTQPLPCLFLIYAQIVLHQALSGTPLIKWGILLNCSTFALKVVWFNKWNEKARCHISVDQMHCDLQSQQYTWNLLENCLLFFSLISYPTYPTYPTYSTNDNKKLCPDAMFNFFCFCP